MRARNIDVDELATIEESGKLSKAGIFYLHFPKGNEEIQQELQFLQLLLKYHEKIIFTSDSPNDWAKFVQNSRQGVAIVCDQCLQLQNCKKKQLTESSFTNPLLDTMRCVLHSILCFPYTRSISGLFAFNDHSN